MSDSIRVFLCDDHTLFRQGVRKLLELEPDMTIVGEANNGQEMLDMLKKTSPDVILISDEKCDRLRFLAKTITTL